MAHDFETFLRTHGIRMEVNLINGVWISCFTLEETVLGHPLKLKITGFPSSPEEVGFLLEQLDQLCQFSVRPD